MSRSYQPGEFTLDETPTFSLQEGLTTNLNLSLPQHSPFSLCLTMPKIRSCLRFPKVVGNHSFLTHTQLISLF